MPAGRATRFRIKVAGVWYIALSCAVGLASIVKGNNFIFLIFSTLLGIFGAAALLTWLMPRRIRVERTVPHAGSVEEPFVYSMRVTNASRFSHATFLEVRDVLTHEDKISEVLPAPVALSLVRPGERVKVLTSVVPRRRGWARLGPVRVTAEFPPGLFTCTRSVAAEDTFLVYPRRAFLSRRIVDRHIPRTESAEPLPSRHTAGEEEFAGLREFRPGDNPHRIHWKMSARIPDRLLIREFEDPRTRNANILLDTFLPNPYDLHRRLRLERAVSFCAALAELLLADRYVVNFRAFAPEPASLRVGAGAATLDELLYLLATLRGTRIHTLVDLAALSGLRSDETSFLASLTPAAFEGEIPRGAVYLTPADMRAMMIFEEPADK